MKRIRLSSLAFSVVLASNFAIVIDFATAQSIEEQMLQLKGQINATLNDRKGSMPLKAGVQKAQLSELRSQLVGRIVPTR